jgi:hypothetical protein
MTRSFAGQHPTRWRVRSSGPICRTTLSRLCSPVQILRNMKRVCAFLTKNSQTPPEAPSVLRGRTGFSHYAVLLGQSACRRDVRGCNLQLVLPIADDLVVAGHQGIVTRFGDIDRTVLLIGPTLVSNISARSKKHVWVAPGIKTATLTPVSWSSWRKAIAKESINAFVAL